MRPAPVTSLVCVAISALVVPASNAAPLASTSTFDAFKTICVDTNADPQRMRTAVMARGGTLQRDQKFPDPLLPLDLSLWQLGYEGQILSVSIGTVHAIAVNHHPAIDSFDCVVQNFKSDPKSIAAFRNWISVKPELEDAGAGTYEFDTLSGRRTVTEKGRTNVQKAMDAGQQYLVSYVSNGGAMFHLSRSQTAHVDKH